MTKMRWNGTTGITLLCARLSIERDVWGPSYEFFGQKHKDEVTLHQHSEYEFWIRSERGYTDIMEIPYYPSNWARATRRKHSFTFSIVCFMTINATENYYSQNIIYSVVKFINVVSHEYEMKVDEYCGCDCVWGLCCRLVVASTAWIKVARHLYKSNRDYKYITRNLWCLLIKASVIGS